MTAQCMSHSVNMDKALMCPCHKVIPSQPEGNTPADRYLHNMPPAHDHWLTSWQGLLIRKHHQSAMIICYVYLLV